MLLLCAFLTFILAIVSPILIALHFYFSRNFKFWHKLGVPYAKPTPFVGNLKDCVLQKVNIGRQLQQIYEQHSDKPYVGIFTFDKPSLLIRDVELVKDILVKDSHNFIDHIISFNEQLDPIFGRGLLAIKGEKWRYLRTKLTPVFSSGKMKRMFYLVDTCGKELADCLHRATAAGSPVDVVETMYRYTTDVIASCAFGINGNSLKDPNAEFRHYARRMLDFSVRKGLAALTAICAPALKSKLKLKFLDDDTNNYMRKIVWSTVEYREKNGVVRNDFLDCMLELRNEGKKDILESNVPKDKPTKDAKFQIDGDVFVAQATMILAGGFETSGGTLCYALYEIALHPEIQNRLRSEILQVLNKHNGQLTYDNIQEMSYLDRVVAGETSDHTALGSAYVTETLRKYPPGAFVDRMSCSDYNLPAPTGNGTITLPAGTGVFIPILGFHHDPTYFPEPEVFDPERFTEEIKYNRPKYAYLPFGDGPRICIGKRFALMQVKTGLCHILSRFEVEPCKDTPASLVFDAKFFVTKIKGEIPLSFKSTQL